jgi:RimJ/RimL family protein N-acetyltransferase
MPHSTASLPDPGARAAEWIPAESPRLPTLHAERVRLRWLDQDDLDALFGVYSDREALRWWNEPPFATTDDASIYLEQVHRGQRQGDLLQWGIERLDGHELIGTALLAGVDPVQGRAELRVLLKSAFWGHGYGREAATALLTHAFGDLGLRRIEAETPPGNRTSLKALEALGFKREGFLRQRWLVRGKTQDSVLLGLLAHEFRAQ